MQHQAVIIIGAGGHALSLAEALHRLQCPLLGCIAPAPGPADPGLLPYLGSEHRLSEPGLCGHRLLNGIGSAGPIGARRAAYLRLCAEGLTFTSLLHPTASIATLGVQLGEAHQILAGSVVNAGVRLDRNVLINSGAIVEHGCRVGDHSHVASGAVICGDCSIGTSVHVGAGAVIRQGLRIGTGAVIAAGAVVTRDVESMTLMVGVPARPLRRIHEQELA